MDVAEVFENGRSQAVRLPQNYRFDGDEVFISRLGSAVLLIPKAQTFSVFMEGLNSFSDDFFAGGRDQGGAQRREEL